MKGDPNAGEWQPVCIYFLRALQGFIGFTKEHYSKIRNPIEIGDWISKGLKILAGEVRNANV